VFEPLAIILRQLKNLAVIFYTARKFLGENYEIDLSVRLIYNKLSLNFMSKPEENEANLDEIIDFSK
jgi:hypothetical protein